MLYGRSQSPKDVAALSRRDGRGDGDDVRDHILAAQLRGAAEPRRGNLTSTAGAPGCYRALATTGGSRSVRERPGVAGALRHRRPGAGIRFALSQRAASRRGPDRRPAGGVDPRPRTRRVGRAALPRRRHGGAGRRRPRPGGRLVSRNAGFWAEVDHPEVGPPRYRVCRPHERYAATYRRGAPVWASTTGRCWSRSWASTMRGSTSWNAPGPSRHATGRRDRPRHQEELRLRSGLAASRRLG